MPSPAAPLAARRRRVRVVACGAAIALLGTFAGLVAAGDGDDAREAAPATAPAATPTDATPSGGQDAGDDGGSPLAPAEGTEAPDAISGAS